MTIDLGAAAHLGLGTKAAAAGGAFILGVAVLATRAEAGIASIFGGGDVTPSASAAAKISPALLALYQQAAATCTGLP